MKVPTFTPSFTSEESGSLGDSSDLHLPESLAFLVFTCSALNTLPLRLSPTDHLFLHKAFWVAPGQLLFHLDFPEPLKSFITALIDM